MGKPQPPTSSRSTKGQFRKGNSGNPAGRPAGSRNRSTLLLEQLLQDEGPALLTQAVEMAKKGNVLAMRLCLERLLPPRKERTIDFALRPLENNAQDLPKQYQDIVQAIAEGQITPTEGESLANILGIHTRALETVELEQRLAALEGVAAQVDSRFKADAKSLSDGTARTSLAQYRKEHPPQQS